MINFRKVKDSDIINIRKLFFLTFKKKISKKYYKERYLNNNLYNAFVALDNEKIIGHVGYKKIKNYTNNNKLMFLYSRHTSMIHEKYRRKGIYNLLCNYSFDYLKKKKSASGVIIWPNSNNRKVKIKNYIMIFFKNHYIYSKFPLSKKSKIQNKNLEFSLKQLKNKITPNKKKFIFKDTSYFKSTYSLSNNNFYMFIIKDSYIIFSFDLHLKNNINILEFSDNSFLNILFDEFIEKFSNYTINMWLPHINDSKFSLFINKGFAKNKNKKFYIGYIPFNKIRTKNELINSTFFNMGDTDVFHKTY